MATNPTPIKIPPPPFLTGQQWEGFNRWLLELTAVLEAGGGIDPDKVAGLSEVIAQSAQNTIDIATLEGEVGGNTGDIGALQASVASINTSITTINSQLTTLGARGELLFGTGAPGAGLGQVNDWYGDTAGAVGSRIWIKKAPGVWTAFPF